MPSHPRFLSVVRHTIGELASVQGGSEAESRATVLAIGEDLTNVMRGKLLDFCESILRRFRSEPPWKWTYTTETQGPRRGHTIPAVSRVDGKNVIQGAVRCLEHNLSSGLNKIATTLDQYFASKPEAADRGEPTRNYTETGQT
jgi:hypothetical protein